MPFAVTQCASCAGIWGASQFFCFTGLYKVNYPLSTSHWLVREASPLTPQPRVPTPKVSHFIDSFPPIKPYKPWPKTTTTTSTTRTGQNFSKKFFLPFCDLGPSFRGLNMINVYPNFFAKFRSLLETKSHWMRLRNWKFCAKSFLCSNPWSNVLHHINVEKIFWPNT